MAEPHTAPAAGDVVNVEDVAPCRKRLTIETPADTVAARLSDVFSQVSTQVRLPGFRPGKAPKALIERRFGKHAREQTKSDLMNEAYQKAIEEQSLRVLGDPEPVDEPDEDQIAPDKPLRFSVEIEVAPTFEPPSLEGLKVKRPMLEVTDEMVDRELDKLAVNEGSLEETERSQAGDYCQGHGVIRDEQSDEVALDLNDAVVQIPDAERDAGGMILGVRVDDLAEQFGTPAVGQTVTIRTTAPDDHQDETIRGRPIVIEYEVQKIHRLTRATIEQLVGRFGLSSEQELREQITRQLNQRIVAEQEQAMREQLAEQLTDAVDFDLPERLQQRQGEQNLQAKQIEMMRHGVPLEEQEARLESDRQAAMEQAKRDIKRFFILERIAEQKQIRVTEADIDERIAQEARQRGERAEQLRQELIEAGRIGGVAQQVREQKVLDELRASAEVEEMPAEDYKTWRASRRGGEADQEHD